MPNRRQFLLTLAAAAFTRCASRKEVVEAEAWRDGRIEARPSSTPTGITPGAHALGLGARDGKLYVPSSYEARTPAPLLLMLHGAGGAGDATMRLMRSHADRHGLVVVAPDSLGRTWDLVMNDIGPDVERIDAALTAVFAKTAIDPQRVAVAGFSDGASYALSLGVANGDLFTHTIAFSPGFLAAPAQTGRSRMYISHGRADNVLPIHACSRRIVPRLEGAGYDVRYREFDGGHSVPLEIMDESMAWFLRREPA